MRWSPGSGPSCAGPGGSTRTLLPCGSAWSSLTGGAGGAAVELTRREFDLLGTLLANPGRAYTRDQLLDEVWGSRYVSEKTIDVHIVGLRRKLGDAVRISTLRGVGYRLETQ